MSDEIKEPQKMGNQGRPKEVKVLGTKKVPGNSVEVLGGGSANREGKLKTLDSHSPVEDQIVEVNVHDDEKSYKEAIER